MVFLRSPQKRPSVFEIWIFSINTPVDSNISFSAVGKKHSLLIHLNGTSAEGSCKTHMDVQKKKKQTKPL